MFKPYSHLLMRIPAFLAVVAILIGATAGVAPALFHGDDLDHCCEFCHLGHGKILKPAAGLAFHAPAALLSQVKVQASPRAECHTAGPPSSRAPPA